MNFDQLYDSIVHNKAEDDIVIRFRTNWLPGVVMHLASYEAIKCERSLGASDYEEIEDKVFEIVLHKAAETKRGAAFRAWVCQVIVYVSKNQLRRISPILVDFTPGGGLRSQRYEKQLADRSEELKDQIEEALEMLPPNQRKAIILRYWRGDSSKETAERLACSSNHVDQWVHKAKKTLAESLAQYRGVRKADREVKPSSGSGIRESGTRYTAAGGPDGFGPDELEPFEPDAVLLFRFAMEDELGTPEQWNEQLRLDEKIDGPLLAGKFDAWRWERRTLIHLLRCLGLPWQEAAEVLRRQPFHAACARALFDDRPASGGSGDRTPI
ncbi:RNA polymerase sigma factor [Paenibacillus sp. GCM10012303]|uniref:RNA polymerase sigma factor n=1 Tax=Paenibacillus sp. GCM10012303 TaxID=3317340 RepID=UPI003616A46F